MGLFDTKKKDKIVAIFDIGSSSVGAALAKIPDDVNGQPHIIASVRTDIVFHDELKFSDFLDDMIRALSLSVEALYHKKLGAPEKIICVLASPWYISETRLIKMERTIPFTFTNKLADELLSKEITGLISAYQKKYQNITDAPELIEHQVVTVSINGYPVDEPLGKKTKQIDMNVIISLAPSSCIGRIIEAVSNTFHNTPVIFSSFMTTVYIAVRDKYISETSYLLVDVGGEVTDISIVSKNILKASVSFPFGRQTFFRFLMKQSGLKDIHEAETLFSMYTKDTLEAGQKEKLKPILASIATSWSQGFRESIESLPQAFSLPGTVFLISDDDVKEWFSETMRCEEYVKSLVVEKKCHIVSLEGPEFLDMCKVSGDGCDPFLMIEAIAIMRKQK